MPTLEDAIRLALEAHSGQVDKAGSPYIMHPLRVMMAVHSEAARMVAVLHDVVEDTSITLDDLRGYGYPENIVQAVDFLTKRPDEEHDYQAFIARVKTNALATEVKLADLADNMDIRRLPRLGPGDVERLEKYRLAWRVLTENL